MSLIFRIEVLPAQRGDALWVEYGDTSNPRRIVIDGGIKTTGRNYLKSRIKNCQGELRIDLLIITHIDVDHIDGILEFLTGLPSNVVIDRIWFNGWDQLPIDHLEPMGVKQGIALANLLNGDTRLKAAWNVDVDGTAISSDVCSKLPEFELPDGMVLTVLSPDSAKLRALANEWDDVVEQFGTIDLPEEPENIDPDNIQGLESFGEEDEVNLPNLATAEFNEDKSAPNGASIAVMLKYAGKTALMLADAHPSLILANLKKLSPKPPFEAHCVKVAHHGSKNNTSRELAKYISSPLWIFSSNGALTKHPNLEAVARVLNDSPGPKSLIFNYKTKFNEVWDCPSLKEQYDFDVSYGDGQSSIPINLI